MQVMRISAIPGPLRNLALLVLLGLACDGARELAPSTGRVGHLAISPDSLRLPVGQAFPLVLDLRSTDGDPLPSSRVAWRSSDPTIAGVDGNGLVTAHVPGVAIISARSDTFVDACTVRVEDAAAGTLWPNEPAGFPQVADQPWSVLGGLWELLWGAVHLVNDPSAPGSPPSVVQVDFPIGFIGGSAPGTEAVALPSVRQVYVGIWWKASDPWQGHVSNSNKVEYLFTGENGSMAMIMYGIPGGPYELRVFPDWHGAWLTPNVADVPVTLGQWHRIEWLVVYGPTSDPPSGIVRWWLDGTLVGDYANVRLSDAPLIQYKMAPVWGGAEPEVKTENDYFQYDHIHISGR